MQGCNRMYGSSKNPLETYVKEIMMFGLTCSPSCAQYVKNLNANRFLDDHPPIVNNHYVDDLMDSVHTEEEAMMLLEEVKSIHKPSGFKNRGILSTSRKVPEAFGEDCKTSAKILDIERILRMFWDVHKYFFSV